MAAHGVVKKTRLFSCPNSECRVVTFIPHGDITICPCCTDDGFLLRYPISTIVEDSRSAARARQEHKAAKKEKKRLKKAAKIA
jgi:hypothetical protein